jgi:hypothetical protein
MFQDSPEIYFKHYALRKHNFINGHFRFAEEKELRKVAQTCYFVNKTKPKHSSRHYRGWGDGVSYPSHSRAQTCLKFQLWLEHNNLYTKMDNSTDGNIGYYITWNMSLVDISSICHFVKLNLYNRCDYASSTNQRFNLIVCVINTHFKLIYIELFPFKVIY